MQSNFKFWWTSSSSQKKVVIKSIQLKLESSRKKQKQKEKTDKGIKLGREGVVSSLDGTKRAYK